MADKMLAAVTAFVMVVFASAQNCNPYIIADLSTCTAHDKTTPVYLDTHAQLKDAATQEHLAEYVLNTTLGMYLYLHPCESLSEAALRLFYGQTTVPDHSSSWWNDMTAVLAGSHGGPLVGRKRKRATHYPDDYALLRAELDQIRSQTGGSALSAECIQVLINEFKDISARTFKAKYPSFGIPPTTHAPTTPRPTTTTPRPTTTTPRPTTTTPLPTTTTPLPTTTTPLPTTTTPPPTTSTPLPTTTQAVTTVALPVAAECTTCAGLECLLAPHRGTCVDSMHEFCVTEITFPGTQITRRCATKQECDAWRNHPTCVNVETHVLSSGVACRYCCSGPSCNHPPQLKPEASTQYTPDA